MLRARRQRRAHTAALRGFTLIEMMVTVTLAAILLALAMPSLTTWTRNVKVRTVADSLQNGLREAQTEALRRSRQVAFSLTNSANPASSLTATANGSNWSINIVKSALDAANVYIESGVLADVGSGVQITGPVAVCFNSVGRLVTNTDTGITGANCQVPTGTPPVQTYDITITGADRPLRVLVALGGQVRMCDRAKTLSATNPDGCP